jgi:MFS transporter, MHS family, shikimate and dehydroshikimate transport protein
MTDSATITREDAGKDVPVTKLAIASTIGTIIEAYDFVLYGTVAALVFDKLFFPDAAPVIATLAAFATFGVGFLARPVGGAIFGHYGDKVGRKQMLVLALVIMGVATVLIGALPGYNSIGIWAPILLVTLRLIQGAALGGEWGGAVLMVTEYAPKGKRGFYGSWPQIGFAGGLAISTSIIWIMSTSLSDAAFQSWGWRVPFFASALLVAVGLYIRLKIEETPAFTELKEKQQRESAPSVEVFRDHKPNLLRAMGMRFSENITFYMLITFTLAYGEDDLGISRNTLLAAIVICATISCFVIPYYGALTDRLGRRKVFLWGAILSVVCAAAYFPLLQTGSVVVIILLFIVVMNTGHDAQYATESAYFSELFPTRIRYSGISISAQLGGVFAGAFAPLIATALLDVSGIWLVTVYFTVMCSISAIAVYFSPETYKADFMGQPTSSAERRERFVRKPVEERETVGA